MENKESSENKKPKRKKQILTERDKEKMREYYLRNKPVEVLRRRENHLKKTYGLSLDDYDKLLAGQDGVCKICHRPKMVNNLHVDHCHSTGRIRGLLCVRCNYVLGLFHDEQILFERSIKYLKYE